MRTTVAIEDAVLREAKRLAARTRRPLGDVVTEALAMLLAHDRQRPPRSARVDLPVSGGGGLRPGVDLEDKDAWYDLLGLPDEDVPGRGDGGDGRRAAG